MRTEGLTLVETKSFLKTNLVFFFEKCLIVYSDYCLVNHVIGL
jgi:hypothetical protein